MTAAVAPAPVRPPRQYIIEGIMPANQVHLLAGPSGAGKTTLVFQMIEAIAKGIEFLGHRCTTVPQAYISCDRNLESVQATLDRMGLPDNLIPMWSTIDTDMTESFPVILNFIRSKLPEVKLIHIDGFTSLCPKGNITDYYVVASFLKSITRTCRSGLTIQGICHDAKLRQGHEYIMERERVIGSSAWGGYADTIVHICPLNPKDAADSRRSISILPRNACNETLEHTISEGRLVSSSMSTESVELFLLEQDVLHHPIDMIKSSEIVAYAATHDIGRSRAYQYIEKLIDLGKLERVTAGGREKGMYKRIRPS